MRKDEAQHFYNNVLKKLKKVEKKCEEINAKGVERDPSLMLKGPSAMYSKKEAAEMCPEE